MTRALAAFDPFNLIPQQPSRTENVEVNAHTEITVPHLRAMVVFRIRLGRAVGALALFALAGGSCYWLVNGPEWAGWITLSGLCLGVCVVWAASAPFSSLERFQMGEITAPGRDTERQAIAEMVLEYLREQQQPVAAPPVVRIESTVRDNGSTTPRTILDDLPGPLDRLQWFCRNILDSRAPFAERTARAPDVGYTREQWATIRDTCIARGWACWNHPGSAQQGVTLLAAGRSALRDIVALAAPYELTPME